MSIVVNIIEVWIYGMPLFYTCVRLWFIVFHYRWTVGDRSGCVAMAFVWPITLFAMIGIGSSIIVDLAVSISRSAHSDRKAIL